MHNYDCTRRDAMSFYFNAFLSLLNRIKAGTMSTATDYLSALPVEVISMIISFQDYDDCERCRFLSKFLYGIYKSTTIQFRLDLDASGLNVGVSANSSVERDKLDISLNGSDHENETSLEAYLHTFKVFELRLSYSHRSILNRLLINGFTSLFIRNIEVSHMSLELNSLQALPTLAPNLEFLKIAIDKEGVLFTGTKPFTNLKTLHVVSFNSTNVLPAISSITKKMPSLTGLMTSLSTPSPTLFVTPSNLEYLDLYNPDGFPVPISATNALTQLHLAYNTWSKVRIKHPQHAPLSNVEIFGFFGHKASLYPIMQYYGIGDNIKTISLDLSDKFEHLRELFSRGQVWKRCPNLECLLSPVHVQIKSLVRVASICTKLRSVSFESLLEDNGKFKTQLLSKTGIKGIILREKLPDKELQFLLDSGIDVVYSGFCGNLHDWLRRGFSF